VTHIEDTRTIKERINEFNETCSESLESGFALGSGGVVGGFDIRPN